MTGFSIYPRNRKNGKPVFYVQFKNPDGSYSTASLKKFFLYYMEYIIPGILLSANF
jgi:hypothetical protein